MQQNDVFNSFKEELIQFTVNFMSKLYIGFVGFCLGHPRMQWFEIAIGLIVSIIICVIIVALISSRWFKKKFYTLAWKRYLRSQEKHHKTEVNAATGK
jgi:TM2 domain-containing membrane protein YozV